MLIDARYLFGISKAVAVLNFVYLIKLSYKQEYLKNMGWPLYVEGRVEERRQEMQKFFVVCL